jgi:phage/plasmid-like protein (TIGR03299 family)
MATKLHEWQKDMLKSGLNWQVEKRPIFDEKGTKLPILGTFRSDTDQFLGPVGENYHIIQNDELFRLPERLVKEGTPVEYAQAGTLKGGLGAFVQYNLPKLDIDVKKKGDIVRMSVMIRTMHNGSGSLFYRLQAERLVCLNGMTAGETRSLAYVRHTEGASERLTEVKGLIANIATDAQNYAQLSNALAATQLTVPQIGEVIERVYHKSDTSNIHTSAVKQNQARDILVLFDANDANTFKGERGTAWNLLNAFTNYADHRMNYRTSGEHETEDDAARRGKLFGVGEALKQRALVEIARVVAKHHNVKIPESYLGAE